MTVAGNHNSTIRLAAVSLILIIQEVPEAFQDTAGCRLAGQKQAVAPGSRMMNATYLIADRGVRIANHDTAVAGDQGGHIIAGIPSKDDFLLLAAVWSTHQRSAYSLETPCGRKSINPSPVNGSTLAITR